MSAALPVPVPLGSGLIFFPIFTRLHHSSLLFTSNLSSPNLLPLALKISVYESLPRLTGFWREQENLPSPVDVNTHSRLGILQLQEQTQCGFFYHKGLIWGIHIVPGEITGTYWIFWSVIERHISVLTAPTMQNNYPFTSYLAVFGMQLNKCLNPRKGGDNNAAILCMKLLWFSHFLAQMDRLLCRTIHSRAFNSPSLQSATQIDIPPQRRIISLLCIPASM